MVTKRKLASIVSADVVGYSRLMADDDRATVDTLKEYRGIITAQVVSHGGRVVDSPGDAFLAEFASAVEALKCAREIQQQLAARNALLPPHRQMLLRIGINVGDVIEEDGALYGDGVNIAARIEALCDPAGICISGTVFDQVEGKVPVKLAFSGEHHVKNIPKPVRVYKVLAPDAGRVATLPPSRLTTRRALIATTIVVLIAAATVFGWLQKKPKQGTTSPADPALAMPSGPSIAVLPFTNMSGTPSDEYFSDGLTEDIITELARFKELHVLARNTTAQYKGKAVDVAEAGRKLGVGYVLEGSVRRTGDKLRVTAQLIETRSGTHLWADRWDGSAKNVFAVQDDITAKVVGAIAGGSQSVLRRAGLEAAQRKDPANLEAYDLVLSALSENWYSAASWPKAKAKLERALQLEPGYARAREEYAWLLLMGWIFRLGDVGMSAEDVKRNAIDAVNVDASDPLAHRTSAIGYYFAGEFASFDREAQIAFSLAPFNADLFAQLGWFYGPPGNWDRAVELVGKAYQLNPSSAGGWYYSARFYHHYVNHRYQEALEAVRLTNQAVCENQMKYILVYGQLRQPEASKPYYQQCLKEVSAFSPEWLLGVFHTWHFKPAHIRQFMEGMALAGYPCRPPACKLDE